MLGFGFHLLSSLFWLESTVTDFYQVQQELSPSL